MWNKHLHIISFDVPYPPDYGGVIDVFYKIKALHDAGISITLHCFQYGRKSQEILESYCKKVYYYSRQKSPGYLLSRHPFIAVTRQNKDLLERLKEDSDPILFEGLHSCFLMNNPGLKNHLKIVRTHNIEHDYYHNLAEVERHKIKKIYFRQEAKKLQKFESILNQADIIAAISALDYNYFRTKYLTEVSHISAFHSNDEVVSKTGRGNFALYHGNLSVGENNQAALYLVKEIFSNMDYPLIIAGNNPSKELSDLASEYKNIELRNNITTQEIHQLISDAQINILPTFQATGIKLKLLAALHLGRHCIVNSPMIQNTGLEDLCHCTNHAEGMKKLVSDLWNSEFTEADIRKRKSILENQFSNKIIAGKLIAEIEAKLS